MCIDTIEVACVDIETEDSEEKYTEKEFDYDKISSYASIKFLLLQNQKTQQTNIYKNKLGFSQSYANLSTPPPELTA